MLHKLGVEYFLIVKIEMVCCTRYLAVYNAAVQDSVGKLMQPKFLSYKVSAP